jgi:hypothetical protein
VFISVMHSVKPNAGQPDRTSKSAATFGKALIVGACLAFAMVLMTDQVEATAAELLNFFTHPLPFVDHVPFLTVAGIFAASSSPAKGSVHPPS